MDKTYLIALLLSTLAGLSTVLGGFVTFFIKKNSLKFLSFGLGLSAGVMLFISLVDLYPHANEIIEKQFGENFAWLTILFFAIGILTAILIDYFIPDHIQAQMFTKQIGANEQHIDSTDCIENENAVISIGKIKKAGILTAIVVAVHNLPEGLATFFLTTQNVMLGLGIVIAIAIHNIPEGMAISIPVYQATHSKRKAFLYSFLSGMAEPIGGIIGFITIKTLFPNLCTGLLFAIVAGIMTYISLDTLLPLSKDYDTGHYSISGVVLGLLLMGFALSILHVH
ncbi:MAG: zinc transporter ZupT [Candidatus Gastranaerophilales bacterium]|nr:zinc transporter ZupT [Candidatus Gastranaerophilales bacterium]